MPPPNTTPATAVVIPSLDYDVVQSDIHDAGTTFSVWYKYTGIDPNDVVGIMFRGAGAYTPSMNLYIDDEFTLLGTVAANRMTQVPLLVGRIYLFEVVPNVGDPNPAVLTVSLKKQPRNGFNSGDIFIRAASILANFQTEGYTGLGGGVIHPTTGVIKDFDPMFQVGEAGDYLSTGEICFADEYNAPFDKFRIYRPTLPLTEKAVVTYNWNGSFPIIRTWREGLKFLVVDKGQAPGNPVEWFTIDGNGVQSAITPVTAGNFGCTGAAMSPAGDKVYLSGIGGSGNTNIKVWNVAGGVFDADFAPDVGGGYTTEDILVMKNGEVIVLYHDSAIDSIFARIYDSTGATIADYTVPIPAAGFTSISPRLGYANDDSVTFWIYPHGSDGFSYFKQVNVADGTLVREFTTPDTTYFTIDQGDTPAFRHVTSDSCPFVLMLGVEGGIFSVTPPTNATAIPSLRRDRYYNNLDKKIPNPTVRTALIGD